MRKTSELMAKENLNTGLIHKRIKSLLADFGSKRPRHLYPQVLFHYTSAPALLGIINSNKIWATNIRYMNDSSELSYTYELANEIINGMRSKEKNKIVQYFFECFADYIKGNNLYNDFFDVYAFCFCENGDQLSQWREYAERGIGYAIGFNAEMITDKHVQRYKNYGLVKVIYERSAQIKYLEYVITSCLSELISLAKLCNKVRVAELVFEFCRALDAGISSYAVQYKDEAFQEEKEWRIVYIQPSVDIIDEIKFKFSNKILIPYVELDLTGSSEAVTNKLPITSIMQGPQSHPEIGSYSLKLFLKQNHYENVGIQKSSISLRF
jgi:hypothetical protein